MAAGYVKHLLTILEKQKPALFDWSLTYLYKNHSLMD